MNEHGFVRAVHSYLKKHFPNIYIWKINDNFAGGVPDAWYCASQNDLWVEYKYITCPKRDTTLIDCRDHLSALQQDWLTKRHSQNISVATIIGSNEGIFMFPGVNWLKPIKAKDLKNGLKPKNVSLWINNRLNRARGSNRGET